MEVKGPCLLIQLCLLMMCTSCLGATERADQPSCQQGNYTLRATNITCKNDKRHPYCTWLLGTQHGNSSVIDTSCNYTSNDESMEMYFALHYPLRQNGYKSWKPCPLQHHTSCFFYHTRITDPLDVMVIINNNRLKACTGITVAEVHVMSLATYTADELQEIELFTARYKLMGSIQDYWSIHIKAFKIWIACVITIVCGAIGAISFYTFLCRECTPRSSTANFFDGPTINDLLAPSRKNLRKVSNEYPRSSQIFSRIPSKIEGDLMKHDDTYKSDTNISWRLATVKTTWNDYVNLNLQSVKLAAMLLRDNVLPTDTELQTIYQNFGKCSKILDDVCAQVCKNIVTVLKLEKSTNVWPAYTLSNNKIVFVVESEMKLLDTTVCGFEIHVVNSDNTLEKESQIVMQREKEILALCYDKFGVEKFQKLKQVISENAERLMDEHESINVITPGVAKSIGYSTSDQHKLFETPCISIYVNKKVRNLIPLGDKPIPSIIDDFPIDVLEGKFDFCSNGPNDYHQILKIGCGIHAGVRTIDGDTLGGTLGAFVKHKSFDLCCITSAHVVLSREELQRSKRYGYKEFANREERKVFQPASELSEEFGKLVAVSYKEGSCGSPGVEVALIQVQRRKPISGAFPHVASGSDQVEHFVYDSGNVIDATLIRPMTEVYKFGMATGPTTGCLGLQGAAVRVGSNHLNDPDFGVRLYNQLEIFPKHSSFAEKGDSGALVFIGHPHSASAIGILEGGLPNGKILVSPIINVLEALNCPCYLHRFEHDPDSGINVDFPVRAEGGNIGEDMEFI